MLKIIENVAEVGTMGGGCGLVLSQIPGVPMPDNLQTWPAQSLMALITLASISVMFFVFRAHLKTAGESAKCMSDSAVALTKVAMAQSESCTLQEETNKLLTETVTKLNMRPCMAEDLVAMMKKTQRIKVDPT